MNQEIIISTLGFLLLVIIVITAIARADKETKEIRELDSEGKNTYLIETDYVVYRLKADNILKAKLFFWQRVGLTERSIWRIY